MSGAFAIQYVHFSHRTWEHLYQRPSLIYIQQAIINIKVHM